MLVKFVLLQLFLDFVVFRCYYGTAVVDVAYFVICLLFLFDADPA